MQGSDFLNYGLTKRDYNLTLGIGLCAIEKLSENLITCNPPSERPPADNRSIIYCNQSDMLFLGVSISEHKFSQWFKHKLRLISLVLPNMYYVTSSSYNAGIALTGSEYSVLLSVLLFTSSWLLTVNHGNVRTSNNCWWCSVKHITAPTSTPFKMICVNGHVVCYKIS